MDIIMRFNRPILDCIFQYLDDRDFVNLTNTCKRFGHYKKYRKLYNCYCIDAVRKVLNKYDFDYLRLYKIEKIPMSVTRLTFVDEFNIKINKNDIQSHVKELIFGRYFNSDLNSLPDSIESIVLKGQNYNCSVYSLPKKLIKLKVCGIIRSKTFILPESLKQFEAVGSDHYFTNLPANLETLKIIKTKKRMNLSSIPKNIKQLYFYNPTTVINLAHFPHLELLRTDCCRLVSTNNVIKNLILDGILTNGVINKLPSTITKLVINKMNCNINSLPENLTELHLGNNFNRNIDYLPKCLTKLVIGDGFNKPVDYLPKLKYLKLGDSFNSKINYLPDTIETLILGDAFNQEICKFPDMLRDLKIGNGFNMPINNMPDRLKKLTLGNTFDQKLESLPSSLEILILGRSYSHDVDNLPNLKILQFNGPEKNNKNNNIYFNKKIDYLPESLEELCLGNRFDQNVDYLPKNINKLYFGYSFNRNVDYMPNSLKILHFGDLFNKSVDNLPDTVEELVFGCEFNSEIKKLPVSLKVLEFGMKFNKNIDIRYLKCLKRLRFGTNFNQKVDNLPPNLMKLDFGHDFNQKVDCLPASLNIIKFGNKFNQSVDNLPKNLSNIKFGNAFNKSVNRLPNVVHIKFGKNFNKNVDNLPDTIEYLEFGKLFDTTIKKFPKNLKELVFGKIFNQPLDNLSKNDNLTSLIVGTRFAQNLNKLPKSVRFITVPQNHPLRISRKNLTLVQCNMDDDSDDECVCYECRHGCESYLCEDDDDFMDEYDLDDDSDYDSEDYDSDDYDSDNDYDRLNNDYHYGHTDIDELHNLHTMFQTQRQMIANRMDIDREIAEILAGNLSRSRLGSDLEELSDDFSDDDSMSTLYRFVEGYGNYDEEGEDSDDEYDDMPHDYLCECDECLNDYVAIKNKKNGDNVLRAEYD